VRPETVKKVCRLIADLCANYNQGNCYLLKEDACAQLISQESLKEGKCICIYFKKAVLPADRELHKAVTDSGADKKPCLRCRGKFTPANNRQMYCHECKDIMRRKKEAARKRQARCMAI
jgi:hypothetical protein